MAWIDIIDEDKAEGDLKDQYADLVEPWGGVDNNTQDPQSESGIPGGPCTVI